MSNNRTLGNLAQFLDSAASGSAISKRNGTIATIAMTDSDVGGVAGSGFTDSNLIKNIVDINHITKVGGITSSSDGIKAILQGNAPTTFNPSVTATYNIGDSSNPIDEIILDSSATIFFGAISLTSVLKSGTSAIAVAAAVVASPVAGSAETSFLLKTDSTQSDAQADASTNAFTITESGNVTSTAFTPYHPQGYGFHFDGSNDTIKYDKTGVDFTGSSGKDMMFECWYTFDTSSPSNHCFMSVGECHPFRFAVNSSNLVWQATGSGTTIVSASVTHDANRWYHLACVRTGDTVSIFRDGTRIATASYTSEWIATGTDQYEGLWVGCARGNAWFHDGKIAQLRLVKGSVTGYDATETSLDVPTAITEDVTGAYLVLNQPNFYDGSSGKRSFTGSNLPTLVLDGGHDHVAYSPSDHGGSVYFDGDGDYLTVASSSNFGFSADFTVEFWLYYTGGNGYKFFWTNNAGSGDYLGYGLNTGSLNPWLWNDANVITTSTAISTNTWQHHAVVRNGSTLTIYLNGVSIGSTTNTTTFGAGSQPFYIGWNGINNQQNTTGYIYDMRVVNGSAVYTADFTPPTEPLTAITNTQLLTCTNKNSMYDASRGAILTIAGNTTVSTTQTKYSSSSVYFDGTGDYITLPSNSGSFDFGTDNFTIEGWFYLTTSGSWTSYWGISQGGGASQKINLYDASGDGTLDVDVNGSVVFSSSAVLSDLQNKWAHIALVREGTGSNQTKLYVNGSVVGQGTVSTNFSGFSQPFTVGHNGEIYSGAFNGYISDFRVTKGLARYTTTFTPPTAALEG